MFPSTGFLQDVAEAEVVLDKNGWLHRQYTVTDTKGEKRWGLAFGHPERLEILTYRGHLYHAQVKPVETQGVFVSCS